MLQNKADVDHENEKIAEFALKKAFYNILLLYIINGGSLEKQDIPKRDDAFSQFILSCKNDPKSSYDALTRIKNVLIDRFHLVYDWNKLHFTSPEHKKNVHDTVNTFFLAMHRRKKQTSLTLPKVINNFICKKYLNLLDEPEVRTQMYRLALSRMNNNDINHMIAEQIYPEQNTLKRKNL